MMVSLAIIGSRNFTNLDYFNAAIDKCIVEYGMPTCVVSGGCRGADSIGEQWATRNTIEKQIFRPEWKRFGKSAALRRNCDIISACTHVLAFPSVTNGSGTQHALRIATLQKKPCMIFSDWENE